MNKVKTKIQCNKCQYWFSAKGGNHKKHIDACKGDYSPPGKSEGCKYCSLTFDGMLSSQRASHTRWCSKNPKRDDWEKRSNCDQMQTPEAIAKRRMGVKKAHADGKYVGAAKKAAKTRVEKGTNRHSEATKELLRQKALASGHRRLVRSIRQYTRKDGSVVMLDSSWEEALAMRLDNMGIEWSRPEDPIKYTGSDGRIHNYFPDFYLPHHNLYLDPKNPAAIKAQKDKIDILMKMMNNLVIIETLDGCNNFYIL